MKLSARDKLKGKIVEVTNGAATTHIKIDVGDVAPGLVGRADITVFPVDCVSHNAMSSAKRICGQLNKPFLALRTSSLAGLLSSLAPLYRPAPPTGA